MPPVADAGQRVDPLFEQVGRRAHVHDLGPTGIAFGPGPAHEQNAIFVDILRRIVDAVVEILRPVKDDRAAFEGFGIVRVRQIGLCGTRARSRRFS